MKRVILFGGSFDPIHDGHMEMAKAALTQRKADGLWFIPTKISPFKEYATDFDMRYHMIKIMIQANDKIKALKIENELPSPSYTYHTVMALKALHPNIQFEYLIGSDQIEKLDQWYEYEKLKDAVQFIVYQRDEGKHDFPVVYGKINHISSTEIRKGLSVKTHPKILEYMMSEGLYLDQMIECRLSDFRYQHTLRVTNLAMRLALKHRVDLKQTYLGAMMHDYCKENTEDIYFSNPKLPKAFDHAFAAASLLAKRYYIKDRIVQRAIKGHVSGDSKTNLGKLLYIADKCEEGRDYDSKKLIDTAMKSLELGFKAVKNDHKDYLEKREL